MMDKKEKKLLPSYLFIYLFIFGGSFHCLNFKHIQPGTHQVSLPFQFSTSEERCQTAEERAAQLEDELLQTQEKLRALERKSATPTAATPQPEVVKSPAPGEPDKDNVEKEKEITGGVSGTKSPSTGTKTPSKASPTPPQTPKT